MAVRQHRRGAHLDLRLGVSVDVQPPDAHIQVEACVGGMPMAQYRPADRDGNTAVLDGQAVRLENASGQMMAERANPRQYFPYGRRALWWSHRLVTPVGPGNSHALLAAVMNPFPPGAPV